MAESNGLKIYNLQGDIVLDTDTKVISNDVVYYTGTAEKRVSYDFEWRFRDAVNGGIQYTASWVSNRPAIPLNNFSLFQIKPDIPILMDHQTGGKPEIAVSANSPTYIGVEFAKYADVARTFVPPKEGKLLTTWGEDGIVRWSAESVMKTPLRIATVEFSPVVGSRPSNAAPMFYDIPEYVDINKVWFKLLGKFSTYIDLVPVLGDYSEDNYFSIKLVGRRLYVATQWCLYFNYTYTSQVKNNGEYGARDKFTLLVFTLEP